MDLRKSLLAPHSKVTCDEMVKWIGNDQSRFDQLFKLFIGDDDPLVRQWAGWPMGYCVRKHPALLTKHIGKLVKNLQKPGHHDAVKRHSLRMLEDIIIPEKHHGVIMNLCFDYIISPSEKPAIKAFSLTVLDILCKHYPEIKQELKTIIEDRWDIESTAFKSRARKILKK